ncbi:carboxypeptidase regulatory-like domain-containing protein [Silvibacterium acidisoli]|uniref:carboxypeptidase regulatory-like domain-containing protein n=1 Tax=Acidobacteriaceae bacterium ZG23-2 TaxID=2883246 RepID=UPI00406CBEAD
MQRRTLAVIAIAASLFSVFSSAFAQNVSATLRGTVRDSQGSVVSGATVTVLNPATNIAHTVTTNKTGDYVVPELPAATYTVHIQASGFQPSDYTGVVLNIQQEARIDATLGVSSVVQQVQVTSTGILLQSENPVNGTVIDQRKLEELPTNSRNFWQLAQLDPNVSPTAQGDSLANRGGFVVAGIIPSNNNYILDGSDDTDWTTGQPTVRPSLDAIQEFRIVTGEAPAEFGRKNGGQIVLTSRSGTNSYHGSAYTFYRNNKINSPQYNFTASPLPPPSGQTKQFGGALGGRFVKDKTFFFAAFEAQRQSADPAVSGTSPLNDWKGGSYTSSGDALFTSRILDPTTGLPFATNANGQYVVPASRVSAASQILLKYFPASTSQNGSVGVFANHKLNTADENQGSFRVDDVLTRRDNLSGIYTILEGRDTGTIGDLVVSNSVVPGFGGAGDHIYQHGSISLLHTFTPSLLNEFRIGFNRMDASYGNQDADQGDVVAQLGLPQGNGYMQPSTNGNTGVPAVAITGISSIGASNNPQWRGDNTVQASDTITWVVGNHTLKAGADALRFFKHSFFETTGRGYFSFGGQYTGGLGNIQNAFADFLLGYITSDSYGTGNVNQYPEQFTGAAYVQDEWKASNSLTLSYGLRWEYTGTEREGYNLIDRFDPVNNQILTGRGPSYTLNNTTGLLQQSGTQPVFHDLWAAPLTNFAPRVGFAYRLFGQEQTAIRGGYGIYYGIPQVQTWYPAMGLGAPFLLTKSFTAPTPDADGVTTNPYLWGPSAFGTSGTQTTNSISITTADPHIGTLYTQQYSLGVQHDFHNFALFEISYQGSRTLHNVSTQNINIPELAARNANPARSTQVNALRPFNTIGSESRWSGISYLSDGFSSNYNSVLLRAERRFRTGLSFQSYLVWAKSLEVSSLQNPYEFASNYGPSAFDQEFRSVTTGQYDLPIGTGHRFLGEVGPVVNNIIGNWQAATILTFQSGRPISTSTTDALASYTGASDRAFVVPGVDQNASIDGNTGHRTHTRQDWFNTAAYRSNAPENGTNYTNYGGAGYVYSYGSAGFDSIRGPGLQDWDLTLIKRVRFANEQSVEFRADTFNILNHPNFNNPSAAYGGSTGTGITQGTTGVITSTVNASVPTATGGPRQFQFALRYSF